MSRARLRQLARLEKLAVSYIAQKRRHEEEARATHASQCEKAFITMANVAVLILYGDPQVGEPLTCAWQRCLQSTAWQACRAKHPPVSEQGRGQESPFDDRGAQAIAEYFRAYILPDLPGADETAKLNAVFAKAPLWLLWFTYAELPIVVLGLKLPDLSSMSRFARPERLGHHYLPDGAFEWRRLPVGVEDELLGLFLGLERRDPAALAKLSPGMRIADEREDPILTPRERLRALRMQERGATSGSGGGSPHAHIDDRPELASVAVLLRFMSQTTQPHGLSCRAQDLGGGNNGRAAALTGGRLNLRPTDSSR
jgi:hypothetical protein